MERYEVKAHAALERYLGEVKASLPEGAGLGEIEAAMVCHNPRLLNELLKSLHESEASFPPRTTGRLG